MTADGEATREHLLEAARDLVVRGDGVDFSLREVARRAGVSAAAVYRHFADKQALLAAVTRIGFDKLCLYLLEATTRKTPRARLDASGDAYLRFALKNPEDYRAIFVTTVRAPAGTKPGEAFQLLVDRVRECMDARVLKRGDAQAVATSIWAHVHGLVSLRLSGHLAGLGDDEAFARFYRQSVERLVSTWEVNDVHKGRTRP